MRQLKDGPIKVFRGTNWKLAGDPKWVEVRSYLANGHEKYVGDRDIDGEKCCVFLLCDDDFGAQSESVVIHP